MYLYSTYAAGLLHLAQGQVMVHSYPSRKIDSLQRELNALGFAAFAAVRHFFTFDSDEGAKLETSVCITPTVQLPYISFDNIRSTPFLSHCLTRK